MTKIFPILFLVGFVACVHLPQKKLVRDEASFFDSKGHVSQAVVDLLALTGTRVKGRPASTHLNSIVAYHRVLRNDDVDSVFNLVQGISFHGEGSWIRPVNKERWEIKSNRTQPQDEAIRQIFVKLGFGKAENPSKDIHNAILMGARFVGMQQRIATLKNLVTDGYRFDHIWMLLGERSLTQNEIQLAYSAGMDISLSSDERDVGSALFYSSFSKEEHRLHTIKSEKLPGQVRARTVETIEQFLKSNPDSGGYVLASSQPFALYHKLQTQKMLKKFHRCDIQLSLAAEPLDLLGLKSNTAELLDNLARIFYVLIR